MQTLPLSKKLEGRPFWIWNEAEHRAEYARTKGACCFTHIAGLPRKDGKEMPMFDYEKKIIHELDKRGGSGLESYKDKHLWILKATGLGVTEFVLRYMAWLCYRNNDYKGAQMCIVTGPNIDRAKDLISRLKHICKDIHTAKA